MPRLILYSLALITTLVLALLSFHPSFILEYLFRIQTYRRRRQMLARLRDHSFSPDHAVLWRNRHKITTGRKTSRPFR